MRKRPPYLGLHLHGVLEAAEFGVGGGGEVEGVGGQARVQPVVGVQEQQPLHHPRQHLHRRGHAQVPVLGGGGQWMEGGQRSGAPIALDTLIKIIPTP